MFSSNTESLIKIVGCNDKMRGFGLIKNNPILSLFPKLI